MHVKNIHYSKEGCLEQYGVVYTMVALLSFISIVSCKALVVMKSRSICVVDLRIS